MLSYIYNLLRSTGSHPKIVFYSNRFRSSRAPGISRPNRPNRPNLAENIAWSIHPDKIANILGRPSTIRTKTPFKSLGRFGASPFFCWCQPGDCLLRRHSLFWWLYHVPLLRTWRCSVPGPEQWLALNLIGSGILRMLRILIISYIRNQCHEYIVPYLQS